MSVELENAAAPLISANDQASLNAEDSAATAQEPLESPDQSAPPVAGEQEPEQTAETETETPESTTPEPDTAEATVTDEAEVKPEKPKARTTKRFNELLTQKREVSAENERLKAIIRQSILGGQQPPAGNGNGNGNGTQPEGSEHYTRLYNEARQNGDEQKAADAWGKRESALKREWIKDAKSEWLQEAQRERHANLFAEELAELNDISPFMDAGGKVDTNAPLVQRAIAEAAKRGDTIPAIGHEKFLYYANKAARNLVSANGYQQTIEKQKMKAKVENLQARTGLEGTKRSVGQSAGAAKSAKIRDLEIRANAGDRNAARALISQALVSDGLTR